MAYGSRINVQSESYDKTIAPNKLRTDGAGNCSITLIYDPNKQMAVMGHFADFNGTYPQTPRMYGIGSNARFEAMMAWAGMNLVLAESKAVVSGMTLYSFEDGSIGFQSQTETDNMNSWITKTRQNLVARLVKAGIQESNIQAMYHAGPNRVTGMEFDLETRLATLTFMGFTNGSRRIETITASL